MRDRSELARKGIARGRSAVVLSYAGGVLFVAENLSSALHKVSEIYDRIGFAAVGRYNEFENLRRAGVRMADLNGISYDRRDVTGLALANAYAQTLGAIFSDQQKPFEVEICVAEVGRTPDDDEIYRLTYDGSVTDEPGCMAMGGQAESIAGVLKASHARRHVARRRRQARGQGAGQRRRRGRSGPHDRRQPARGRRAGPVPPGPHVPPDHRRGAGRAAQRRREGRRAGRRGARRRRVRRRRGGPGDRRRQAAGAGPRQADLVGRLRRPGIAHRLRRTTRRAADRPVAVLPPAAARDHRACPSRRSCGASLARAAPTSRGCRGTRRPSRPARRRSRPSARSPAPRASCRSEGVPPVVPLAVGDPLDPLPARAAGLQQPPGELPVGQLGTAADVVDLARPAAAPAPAAMPGAVVAHVQPVAHVAAVAVERHRAAVEQVVTNSGMTFSGYWYGP